MDGHGGRDEHDGREVECEIVEGERPPHHMTRRQVSVRLGCSEMQVVRLEQFGRLHPVRVERRVWFKVEEVIQVAGTWRRRRRTKKKALDALLKGRLEAQCYALFAAGKEIAEIVMITECSSDLVEEFYKNYRGGSLEHRYWLQSRERELAREAYRQRAHDKREALRESREFRLRQAELLAKAGGAKPPGKPPTVGRFARDQLLEKGGLPARPVPGEASTPTSAPTSPDET